jgi:sugar phosphate isomerase/epimerase
MFVERREHLHDNNGDGDFHLVPSRGNIDWKDIAEVLRDISYTGVLDLELPLPIGTARKLGLK